ncbi:ATP-binding cassette domain-containing protein [Camelliibacillus cellulosilyticus]|uniref:ATP-binding cassette domain-containing protein n=1 Tax=Camelliibacillus cellulosilyticus TaxID=2174486 RepID=A0ABV9GQV1_9BACL
MIVVENLSKSFKVAKRSSGLKEAFKALFYREHTIVRALSDVSFSISPGEIVGYIGPNGAGKSTTIKVMSGILVPDHGTCNIMGYTPWRDRARYVKNIGVVFGQRTQLWWDVPVIDSFELLRDIYKVPATEYQSNLDLLVDTLDLKELIYTPVRQLSLGQRMRCEIAASLLHSPQILFLDEPTIGLDALSKIAVRQFIKKYNEEKGLTVILTTHDMNDIEALANRIILIGKGHLLYDGRLIELRRRFDPKKTMSAQYRETDHVIQIPGTTLMSRTPERATISVDTEQVNISDAISQLTRQVELVDVTVEAESIEEIIARLYREYEI